MHQASLGAHPVRRVVLAAYQVGAEIGLTEHLRAEPSVTRQVDTLPDRSGLYAFALVARWYY